VGDLDYSGVVEDAEWEKRNEMYLRNTLSARLRSMTEDDATASDLSNELLSDFLKYLQALPPEFMSLAASLIANYDTCASPARRVIDSAYAEMLPPAHEHNGWLFENPRSIPYGSILFWRTYFKRSEACFHKSDETGRTFKRSEIRYDKLDEIDRFCFSALLTVAEVNEEDRRTLAPLMPTHEDNIAEKSLKGRKLAQLIDNRPEIGRAFLSMQAEIYRNKLEMRRDNCPGLDPIRTFVVTDDFWGMHFIHAALLRSNNFLDDCLRLGAEHMFENDLLHAEQYIVVNTEDYLPKAVDAYLMALWKLQRPPGCEYPAEKRSQHARALGARDSDAPRIRGCSTLWEMRDEPCPENPTIRLAQHLSVLLHDEAYAIAQRAREVARALRTNQFRTYTVIDRSLFIQALDCAL